MVVFTMSVRAASSVEQGVNSATLFTTICEFCLVMKSLESEPI